MDDDAIKGNIGVVTGGKAENEKGNSEHSDYEETKVWVEGWAGSRVSRRKGAEKKTTMSLKKRNRTTSTRTVLAVRRPTLAARLPRKG